MLSRAEKQQFIADLLDTCHAYLIDRLDRVPEDWDGHELRKWVADVFAQQTTSVMKGKRAKAYDNALVVNNL